VPVETAVRQLLPEVVDGGLSQARVNVMVVTASPTTARMELLSSWDSGIGGSIRVRDAALATSAAPSYFPEHRVRLGQSEIDLGDGGIAANAPDAVAVHRAARELSFPVEQTSLLSVGTCSPVTGGSVTPQPSRRGIVATLLNLGGHGIVDLMMAIQEERGISEAFNLLGADRYLRIDKPTGQYQGDILALDNAGPESQLTLEALAKSALDDQAANQSHSVWQLLRARGQSMK